jgi:regulator of protease activity HflC (stomatin/prohibitin superfamily)
MNITIVLSIVFGIIALVSVCMYVFPIYGVWQSEKQGMAKLKEANYEEQITIAKASARLKAAEANKQAELIEAEAVAQSISIIGDSISINENYLRWQWIKGLDETKNRIIYIPTEAGLPILEAGKRPD